jgi:hypothetical protein
MMSHPRGAEPVLPIVLIKLGTTHNIVRRRSEYRLAAGRVWPQILPAEAGTLNTVSRMFEAPTSFN